MRWANISDNRCLTSNGLRASLKQAANRSSIPILPSTSRDNSEPPSVDTWPAVNPASTRREKWAANENVSWLHSVCKGRSFSGLQLRLDNAVMRENSGLLLLLSAPTTLLCTQPVRNPG